MHIKIGKLFYLKAVEVGVAQKRKSLQRLASQQWAKTYSCSQRWHVFTSLQQTLSLHCPHSAMSQSDCETV